MSFDFVKVMVAGADIGRILAEQSGLQPPPIPHDELLSPPVPVGQQWTTEISAYLSRLDDFIQHVESISHRLTITSNNEDGSQQIQVVQPTEIIEKYAISVANFLLLSLRPFAEPRQMGIDTRSKLRGFIYSLASSGFMDVFTGKNYPVLFEYMLQFASRDYGNALLLMSEVVPVILNSNDDWDPRVSVSSSGHVKKKCSACISDPIAEMLSQTGFISKAGNSSAFYVGASKLFVLQEIGDTEFDFLHGMSAAALFGILGEEYAKETDDLENASELNNLWSTAMRQLRQNTPDPMLLKIKQMRIFVCKEAKNLRASVHDLK